MRPAPGTSGVNAGFPQKKFAENFVAEGTLTLMRGMDGTHESETSQRIVALCLPGQSLTAFYQCQVFWSLLGLSRKRQPRFLLCALGGFQTFRSRKANQDGWLPSASAESRAVSRSTLQTQPRHELAGKPALRGIACARRHHPHLTPQSPHRLPPAPTGLRSALSTRVPASKAQPI